MTIYSVSISSGFLPFMVADIHHHSYNICFCWGFSNIYVFFLFRAFSCFSVEVDDGEYLQMRMMEVLD